MNQTPPGTSPPPLPPRTAAPPPKKRMHGCLIALIVALCLMVPVVGILAAIAIPAYNDYVARAKVAQAMGTTMALRWRVVEFREREERCPVNGDAGFSDDDLVLGPPVASVRLGDAGENRCTITLTLGDATPALDGRHLDYAFDPGTGDWRCRSDVDARHLPAGCGP